MNIYGGPIMAMAGLFAFGYYKSDLDQPHLSRISENIAHFVAHLFFRESIHAEGMELHAPSYPWPHRGYLSAFDHAR
jgi:hypothetical protein